jgi:hypothetical protein
MSSPTWQDRRFMFKVGKEVHEPSRKMSASSDKGAGAQKTATSPTRTTSISASSAGEKDTVFGRRRVRFHHWPSTHSLFSSPPPRLFGLEYGLSPPGHSENHMAHSTQTPPAVIPQRGLMDMRLLKLNTQSSASSTSSQTTGIQNAGKAEMK